MDRPTLGWRAEDTALDTLLPRRRLGRNGPEVTRLGLGLAALGRPGYHNLGHAQDVGTVRAVDQLEARCHAMLDHAWEAGVRYFDVARSYGLGEQFLHTWLERHGHARPDVSVGSKWGYVYTADWKVDAAVHEVKDHSADNLARQELETWALLGRWICTYSIHSATFESGVLADDAVLDQLAALRERTGVRIGLTVTGVRQAEVVRHALALRGGGFFDVVQATCNLLDPSVLPALVEAHAAGLGVVVKEVFANGRLSPRARPGPLHDALVAVAVREGRTLDALALAWVLAQPCVDVALSGAATTEQLSSHLTAFDAALSDDALYALSDLALPAERYWAERSALPWT